MEDIKLDNEAKRVLKEGIMLDSSLNTISTEDKIMISNKVTEREAFSNYVYPPLKYRFPRFVRTVSYVLSAVRKFKLKMVVARQSRGLPISDGSTIESMTNLHTKFKMFSVSSHVQPNSQSSSLVKAFNVMGVSISTNTGKKRLSLSDSDLSLGLEYIYRKASTELMHFNDSKLVEKIGVLSDGIVYCKSRIEEGQNLRVVGGLEEFINLQSFTGIDFNVPVIDRYSPIAISLAYYIHYSVVKHRGSETTFRMSLQFAKILGGRVLMKHIRDECTFCQKLLLRYVRQTMGPLSDQQLSISPVFYYCLADAWGPLRAYVPNYQRNTRAGDKTYDIYMLIFGCAATSTINCQVMEGGKSASHVLDALNRFFAECCVPKVFFIDKDSALIKALTEAQIEVLSNDGVISRERGITFQTCPAQGHSAHGRIERRIKMVQEAFERSDMKQFKLHGLGWQSLAKRLEYDVNSIPLGYLSHREDNVSILRILTPNFLKINAGSNRAPNTLFTLPTDGNDLSSRVESAYRVFYKVWNDAYVPLMAKPQRWFQGDDDLRIDDIVYFKLRDSVLASTWLIGKIEDIIKSKDGKVRRVLVGYRFNTEDGVREFKVVERPVRECVRLMNIEDTTLMEDIKSVREASQAVLGTNVIFMGLGSDAEEPLGGPGSDAERSFSPILTYACNSTLVPGYRCTAVDIGTHAISYDDEGVQDCCGTGIGHEEARLGLDYDKIFDITNDIDDYDKFNDISLILL